MLVSGVSLQCKLSQCMYIYIWCTPIHSSNHHSHLSLISQSSSQTLLSIPQLVALIPSIIIARSEDEWDTVVDGGRCPCWYDLQVSKFPSIPTSPLRISQLTVNLSCCCVSFLLHHYFVCCLQSSHTMPECFKGFSHTHYTPQWRVRSTRSHRGRGREESFWGWVGVGVHHQSKVHQCFKYSLSH